MTEKHDTLHRTNSVGFKRPPKDGQFRPGQSGNQNGRPKGVRNFKTDLKAELSEIILFRDGDVEVPITKQRALIKQLIASAIAGNAQAIATAMSICLRAFGDADSDDATQAAEDREIVNVFTARPARRNTNPKTHTIDQE